MESIPVIQAAGRVTAGPVYARICAPHYNASAMDGVALAAKQTSGASRDNPVVLTEGSYRRVNTGDPLPDGCDAVVMIEDVEVADGQGFDAGVIRLFEAATPWQHIRQIGEDICAGEMILPSFSRVTPAALGAILAGGVTEIAVIKRPVVGIIPTGDELVPATCDPKAGEIAESNSVIFSAMVREWGADAVTFPIVSDDYGKILDALENALSKCDIVILNAGSSAGSKDYSAAAIGEVGAVLYNGLAIKPGRPAILGYSGSKPILCVPGYPVSGMIVIEQVLRPIIEYLCKKTPEPYR